MTVVCIAMAVSGLQSAAVGVPLVQGLSLVESYRNSAGDFETIITVSAAASTGVTLSASTDESSDTCGKGSGSPARRSWGLRTVLQEDLENASAMRQEWAACPATAQTTPGATAISVSARVLRGLRTAGETRLTADTSKAGMVAGTLTRVERTAIPVEIVVNDRVTALPTVHARWHSAAGDREYWILDDAANPLVLRAAYMGTPYLQVVKLSFPTGEAPSAHIDSDLAKSGRTTLYGIYFNSGSDRLRDESEAVLGAVAGVLRQHPAWTLTIEGHTDNLGGDAYNADLSRRRAAAVTSALVTRYKIAPARLKPAGFGASRPTATNDTLDGRARNRRVELVRQ